MRVSTVYLKDTRGFGHTSGAGVDTVDRSGDERKS